MSNNNNDYLLLSLFNDMYNNNNRTIDNLVEQNNNIRNNIMEIHRNNRRNYFPLNTRQNNRGTLFNDIPNIRTNNLHNSSNNLYNSSNNLHNSSNNLYDVSNNLYDVSNNRVPFLFTYSTILPNNNFLDSVNISPNNQQINIATRNLMYCDIMNPVNTSCPISLEPFNDSSRVTMIRHCRHIFNTESLSIWFRTNCRCPICRYDIRDYNTQSDETNINILSENNASNTGTSQNASNTGTSQNASNTGTSQNASNTGTSQNAYNTETSQNAYNTETSQNTTPVTDFTFTFNTNESFPQINDNQVRTLITELLNNYRRQL
jgi:hypothetical protein